MSNMNTNGSIVHNGRVHSNGAAQSFEQSKEDQEALLLWKSRAESARTTGTKFTTLSGKPLDVMYSPGAGVGTHHATPDDFLENVGFPGQFPYTRGIHPNG